MKRVAIFGSTGSIGKATLEVIKHLQTDFSVLALAARSNYPLLTEQIITFKPKIIAITEEKFKDKLYQRVKKEVKAITILSGESSLVELAQFSQIDILVMAMSGTTGLMALIKAIENKKRIALSTKELLVSFGKIIMQQAKKYQAEILPIDSELVGIHQCINNYHPQQIKRVILTASGGPFLYRKHLKNITIRDALKHPIWKMGKKITIDSATLANKGLEVIETARLFSLPPQKIEVLIHPQSIIHAIVEFNDNISLATLSYPDMRGCIQYALTYPKRLPSLIPKLDLVNRPNLEFYQPDFKKFPALKLAYQAAFADGTAPCVFNSANEVAVNSFIAGVIQFNQIPQIIQKTLSALPYVKNPNLITLLKYQKMATDYAERLVV